MSAHESSPLHCFPRVVLNNASECPRRLADHNITKSNIILFTRCPTSNTNHQAKPQPFKTGEHLGGHYCSRCSASNSRRQAGKHDVVYPNTSQHIRIVIVWILLL